MIGFEYDKTSPKAEDHEILFTRKSPMTSCLTPRTLSGERCCRAAI